jgi:hypothetical protein
MTCAVFGHKWENYTEAGVDYRRCLRCGVIEFAKTTRIWVRLK